MKIVCFILFFNCIPKIYVLGKNFLLLFISNFLGFLELFQTLRSFRYPIGEKKLNACERVQANVADDILKVMDMATESSFIRYSIISSDGPIIIMFNKDQILDMKSSLESESVLGMDIMYNLCPYFLSTFTYQNLKV